MTAESRRTSVRLTQAHNAVVELWSSLMEVLGMMTTAVVGIVGIMSTHLLARSQRKADHVRAERDRKQQLISKRHEAELGLCSEFLAELRMLEVALRLRMGVTLRFRQGMVQLLTDPRLVGALEEKSKDKAEAFRAFVAQIEGNPAMVHELIGPHEGNLPKAIDPDVAVRRLVDLSTRLQVVGGSDVSAAASHAEKAAVVAILKVQAEDTAATGEEVELDELVAAIDQLAEASLFELRLVPFGERRNLADLQALAAKESEAS